VRRLSALAEREEAPATDEQREDVVRVAEALEDSADVLEDAAERLRDTYNALLRAGLHQGALAASLDAAGLKDLRHEASRLMATDGYGNAEAAALAMVEAARRLRHAVGESAL